MKKIKRIRPKMLISLLTTFLIILGIFLALVITRTTTLADEMAINLAKNAAENHANAMANVFSKTDDMVLGLKIAAEQFESMPGNDRRAFLDNLLREAVNSEMTQILGAWACFEPNMLDGMDEFNLVGDKAERTDATGRYITYFVDNGGTAERRILTDYDIPGIGDYYLVARDTGKPYVTPPFDSEVGDVATSVLSIAYPVKNRVGEIAGVIGVNYTLDYINALNENVTLFENGFGKLLTGEGVTVAHKDTTLTGTNDTDFTEAAEAAEIRADLSEGNTFAKKMYSPFLGADTYTAVTNVLLGNSGINWIYAVIVPEAEVLESSRAMIAMIIMVAVIGAVAAALIIVVLANNIAKPVRVMCGIANKIAVGDLTASMPAKFLNNQDEIGDLSRDIKKMQDNLVSTLSGIDMAVDSLHSQVVDGTQAIDVLNDRLFAISTATEELCAGMETTSTSTVRMSSTTAEIENAVEMVAEKSGEGAGKSSEIQVRASQLGKNVTGAIDTSNHIFDEIKQALEKALADSKAVEEINALADAILGITSQTTLLALNASIEAARAGEVGRGFAVVAKEISTLADNSKNTVTQIQVITKEVMSAVNALAGSSTDLLNFVSGNVQKDYQDMLTAADSYTNDAVYISDMTTDLSATSQKLMAAIQIMLKGISDVSMSAQEGAIATASLAEQTSGIAGNAASVVENMNQTQRTSEELAELVNQFKL